MKTRAALSTGPETPFEIVEIDLDDPRDDEIVVRIVASGLCHTDISVRDTLPVEMFPRVFGHEGAGVVEQVGKDVSGISVGDHVVLSLSSCRACERCAAGEVGYCNDTVLRNYMGFRADGSTTYTRDGAPVYGNFFGQSSFAERVIATADNVVVVDKNLDLTRLGPYGCAFQTGAGTLLNVLKPGASDAMVVYGVGAVGLAAIAMAQSLGVGTVVAVDLSADRLAVAADLGATTVNPSDPTNADKPLADLVKAATNGGATHSLDTTGVAAVIKDAVTALRPRGTLVVVGLGAPTVELDAVDLMMNGKVIRGCIEGDSDPLTMVPQLLELAASGKFGVDHLIQTYPFTDINSAAADLLAARVVKPVLVWE